jgi:hypothetical protein
MSWGSAAISMSGPHFRKPVGYATGLVRMTRCIKKSASEEAPKHGHELHRGCEGQPVA